MTGLIRAELLKFTKRRMYWVMVLILVGLMGMTGFLLILLPQIAPEAMEGFTGVAKPESYVIGAQQAIGQTWFPLILAVVFLGGEVGTTAWASSLTCDARRWAHLLAKAAVLSVFAWLAALVVIGLWSAATAIFATGSGAPTVGEWWGVIWKVGLVQAVWVCLGLGAVSLLRSTGPAIGLALAFSFGESILTLWPPYRTVALASNTTALFGQGLDVGDFGGMFGLGSPAEFGVALVVVLAWGALGLGAAWASLTFRDA